MFKDESIKGLNKTFLSIYNEFANKWTQSSCESAPDSEENLNTENQGSDDEANTDESYRNQNTEESEKEADADEDDEDDEQDKNDSE